jgi:cell wall assembly regulator SMI1
MGGADQTAFWDRIDKVMERYVPQVFERLLPPAKLWQIEEAERAMGVTLIEEVRVAYLRHNGCKPIWRGRGFDPGACGVFLPQYSWCDLDAMVEHWQHMKSHLLQSRRLNPEIHPEPEPWWDELHVRPEEWNTRWVPIGLHPAPAALYIDLQPAGLGTVGQIIHSDGSPESKVYAPSFNWYFTTLIDGLEAGLIRYDEKRSFVSTPTDKEILRLFPEPCLF